jgi:hypothetical protein
LFSCAYCGVGHGNLQLWGEWLESEVGIMILGVGIEISSFVILSISKMQLELVKLVKLGAQMLDPT